MWSAVVGHAGAVTNKIKPEGRVNAPLTNQIKMRSLSFFFAVMSVLYMTLSSYAIVSWDNTPFQLLFLQMTWSASAMLFGVSAHAVGWIREKYMTAIFVGGVMCFAMSIIYSLHNL